MKFIGNNNKKDNILGGLRGFIYMANRHMGTLINANINIDKQRLAADEVLWSQIAPTSSVVDIIFKNKKDEAIITLKHCWLLYYSTNPSSFSQVISYKFVEFSFSEALVG